jgi:aryl-alcohol dehydrogenase-like predicted oxidoreductase
VKIGSDKAPGGLADTLQRSCPRQSPTGKNVVDASRCCTVLGRTFRASHSTFPVSAIVEAQWAAQRRGRERFVCEQPPYSILTRGIEADVLPTCARYGMGMGVVSYSPLAQGWLSGRYRKDSDVQGPMSPARQRLANRFDMSLAANQRKRDAAEQLAELADKAGMTLIQLAIYQARSARLGADRSREIGHLAATRPGQCADWGL